VAQYVRDPLVYRGGIRARFGAEVIAGIDHLRALAPTALDLPLLLLHADDDRLTDVSGSRWVAANAASRDVTLRIVEGGTGHEIYNSAQGDALIDEAIAWISARA
jgi:alpha-beta hydrolase superfamily lysophospholipase